MQVEVQQRIVNHLSVTANENSSMQVNVEVGIFADQDYEKFTEKTTCNEKRDAAAKIIRVEAPIDGEWGTKNVTIVTS